MDNLTSQEIAVLKFINETYNKKLRLKMNASDIANNLDMNTLQVDEMLERFKEKGLIKKKKGRFFWLGEFALDIIIEILGSS